MKIHFCDLCNESVPQSDLDAGRARIVKGRVVCGSCERAMSLAAASEPAPSVAAAAVAPDVAQPLASAPSASGSSSAPVWMAAASLIAIAVVIYVFQQRIELLQDSNQQLARGIEAQRGSVHTLEARLTQLGPDEHAMEQRLAAHVQEALAPGETQRADLAAATQRAEQALGELKNALAELRKDLDSGVVVREQRIDELSHRVALSEDVQRQLAGRLNEVQKTNEDAQFAADAAAKSKPSAPAAAKSDAAWKVLLPNLADASPSMRWEAVDALGRSKDPAAIPHVTPLLKDSDLFVRMCAARVLADLGTLQGVPALIDALEDAEPTVRESAWRALQTLTGKDFKFDPQANEGERSKKVKLWREWWKKDGEPLLNGGTAPEGKSGTKKS